MSRVFTLATTRYAAFSNANHTGEKDRRPSLDKALSLTYPLYSKDSILVEFYFIFQVYNSVGEGSPLMSGIMICIDLHKSMF